jgi:outer membrane protein/S-layer protein transport system outer membrane protein
VPRGVVGVALAIAISAVQFAGGGGAARAETLKEAMDAAYGSNPNLVSQRFQQRVFDEQFVQAEAGMDPTLSLVGSAGHSNTLGPAPSSIFSPSTGNIWESPTTSNVALDLQQPLYNGGQTAFATRAARAQVLAGRANLAATEGQLVLQVIQAYMSVLRYQNRVHVAEDNLKALQDEYAESRAKRAVRQSTLTDLSQSEGRMRGAEAQLSNERAQLAIAASQYSQVVGHAPGRIEPPPGLRDVPDSVDQAFNLAEANNPQLAQARLTEEASRQRIQQAKGALRPVASADVQVGYGTDQYYACCNYPYERNFSASVTVKFPLYWRSQASAVRQQVAQNGVDRMAIEQQRRAVLQSVAQAWNQLSALRVSIISYHQQVEAFQRAYYGMGKEEMYGLRSHFEVLLAEQDLASAELVLYDARYSEYVAQASLLYATGSLTARSLDSSLVPYQSEVYLRKADGGLRAPWVKPLIAVDGAASFHAPAPGLAALQQGGRTPAGAMPPPPPAAARSGPLPSISSSRMKPERPEPISSSGADAPGEPVRAEAPGPAPTPTPAAAAALQPPAAAPVRLALREGPAPWTPAAVGRSEAPPGPPVRRGRHSAQVVSFGRQDDTRRALAALRSQQGAGLAGRETRIETADVGGRTVYRGLVGGFASFGEAQAFCAALKQRGEDCLAR